MVCLKEVLFEYIVRLANNFGRKKIKGVVIFPVVFSNGGFIKFLITNIEFSFIYTETVYVLFGQLARNAKDS